MIKITKKGVVRFLVCTALCAWAYKLYDIDGFFVCAVVLNLISALVGVLIDKTSE